MLNKIKQILKENFTERYARTYFEKLVKMHMIKNNVDKETASRRVRSQFKDRPEKNLYQKVYGHLQDEHARNKERISHIIRNHQKQNRD